MDAIELAQRYVDALQGMNIAGKIDESNEVIFKVPGLGTCFIDLEAEDDPEFMRIIFPNFHLGVDQGIVLRALNSANIENKAVKLWALEVEGGFSVSASIEFFLADLNEAPEAALLRSIIERCIAAIRVGAESFVQEINLLGASG